MKLNKKNFTILLIILALVVYIGIEGYRYTQRQEAKRSFASSYWKENTASGKSNIMAQTAARMNENKPLYSVIGLSAADAQLVGPIRLACLQLQSDIDSAVKYVNSNEDWCINENWDACSKIINEILAKVQRMEELNCADLRRTEEEPSTMMN